MKSCPWNCSGSLSRRGTLTERVSEPLICSALTVLMKSRVFWMRWTSSSSVASVSGQLGTSMPAHVLTPSVTARGILNMTALAAVEAQRLAEARG